MTPPRVLLLDFDGVLRHWRAPVHEIEACHGLPAGALFAVAFRPGLLGPAVRGDIDDAEWRRRVAEALASENAGVDAVAAVAEWSQSVGELDRDVQAIVAARVPGVRLVLVSNATTRLRDDLSALGIADAFDAIIASCEVRAAKPDAAIFDAALAAVGANPRDAVFVDDDAHNVAAAQALGIASHRFEGAAGLVAFLRDRGVLG